MILCRLAILAVGSFCLCGCFGTGTISYSPAAPAAPADVPQGAERRQIAIPIRVVTLDPDFARDLGLVDDFGRGAGSLLTRNQADKLLKSLRDTPRASVITAPQVVVFNGQAANVRAMNNQPYISAYRFNGADYQAITDTVESGIAVDVLAVSGAQPKVVTLMLKVHLSRLLGLRSVPAENVPAELKLPVQRPEVDIQELQTLATVPAGSTLALMQPAEVDGRMVRLLVLATPQIME